MYTMYKKSLLLLGFILISGTCITVANQFLSKRPAHQQRKESNKRDSLKEDCAHLADRALGGILRVTEQAGLLGSRLYRILHDVTTGNGCVLDTATVETLTSISQQLEALSQSLEGLDKKMRTMNATTGLKSI